VKNPEKAIPYLTFLMILAIGGAYFIFLAASWNEFQKRNTVARDKIDELLERLPKPNTDVVSE
jgi:hypothetical protein